jgi:hypothetical protein
MKKDSMVDSKKIDGRMIQMSSTDKIIRLNSNISKVDKGQKMKFHMLITSSIRMKDLVVGAPKGKTRVLKEILPKRTLLLKYRETT